MSMPAYSDRFGEALSYAWEAHRHQTRKGSGIPYMAHLMAVAALVIEAGAAEEVAIAALLHDAVEDSGGQERLADIRNRFGENIARWVEACSDTDETPKPPYRERKQKHLDKLYHVGPEVRLITLADKLHNLRSMLADYEVLGEALWTRFNGGRAGTLWYYEEMCKALDRGDAHPLHRSLTETLALLKARMA